MRSIIILILVLALGSCMQKEAPPNILLIVVDDLGWSDLQCYGNQLVATPNIDQLALDGVRFTSAYASCTVCSPTRAALMTGKNPVAVNITDWIPGHQDSRGGPAPHEKFIVPRINQELPLKEITLAEILSEAGYHTASIGKWHLGGEGYLPTNQGFDLNVAGYRKGSPPSYYYPYTRTNREDVITPLKLNGDSLYLTDRLTNEAIRFMGMERDDPFFLYLPYYNVHTPLEGRPDLVEKYKIKLGAHRNDSIQRNPHFLAMTEAVDENVGRIIQFLKDSQMAKNTLVIFTSDNGGLLSRSGQDKDFIRASWNHPFREGKGTLYEGGLRIPTIMSWPGRIDGERLSDEIILSTDIYPTLAEVAGVAVDHSIEGVSLLKHLLSEEAIDRETIYWHYPHYHIGMPGGVIRDGEFKLIEYFENGDLELYDLARDPGETTNLAAEQAEKAEAMLTKLRGWRNANQAKMPSPNPDYNHDY